MAEAKQFDFTEINNATRNLPVGMKIGIAKGLIKNVISTFERFENTLEDDANELLAQIEEFHEKYKKAPRENKKSS
jgi:hypothetical protein